MVISLITPAPKHSRTGNRVTALRWAAHLEELGHQVAVKTEFNGDACDLMLALHARRSHSSIVRFRESDGRKPLIVALTGTDLYGDIRACREAQESLELADRLVLLQPLGIEELPEAHHAKTRTIYQSAVASRPTRETERSAFDVCVLGHLREIKDPFLAAVAVRDLPDTSRIRVQQVGAALTDETQRTALAEMETNSRYNWLGEKPRNEALGIMAGCKLLVLSSASEGGANVISEAIVSSVPVLSSRIPGSVGLLGEDYRGYFPVGDTQELRKLLLKAENESTYLGGLRAHCEKLKPLFQPEREIKAWRDLLEELA